MACEQYTAGTNAEITLTEATLPAGFCPTTWQDVLHGFIGAMSGNLSGTYSTFVVRASQPVPADQDKLWLKLDASNCRPDGFYLFYGGAWVRIDSGIFYGDDDSVTPNAYNVTTLTPNINFLTEPQLYVVKASTANTATATITLVPITGATNIPIVKYGSSALEGYEILADMFMLLAYDSVAGQFNLLNPRPLVTYEGYDIQNASFEIDDDSDDMPDHWDYAVVQSVPPVAPPTAGLEADCSAASLDSAHGCRSFGVTQLAGNTTVYSTLTTAGFILCRPSEIVYLTWSAKTTANNLGVRRPAYVNILFYDAPAKNDPLRLPVSTTTLWTFLFDGATVALCPTTWARFGGVFQVPGTPETSDIRFFKIQIQVGNDDAGTAKAAETVYFDDFRLGFPVFPNTSILEYRALTLGWIAPALRFNARVRMWGGGGGGGARSGVTNFGGGGGGGAYTEHFATIVPGTTYNCVTGIAGAKGSSSAGSNGGTTSFDLAGTEEITAPGGSGGAAATTGGAGGLVGTPVAGNAITLAGETGGNGDGVDGGIGGISPSGGGNAAGGTSVLTASAGQSPGGGGGGADSLTAADGAAGKIIIEWF